MTKWQTLFNAIDWNDLQNDIDSMLSRGADKLEVNERVKDVVSLAAAQIDIAIDFDKIINGAAEPIGDLLEAIDYGTFRGAMLLIVHLSMKREARLTRRIGRISVALLDEESAKKRTGLTRKLGKLKLNLLELQARRRAGKVIDEGAADEGNGA